LLRLISANLRHGGADPAALEDLIERENAAIVAVQELGPALAETLGRLLPHGKLEPTPDGLGLGVALRRPAVVERLPLPVRDARVARLETEDWPELDGRIEILNVHIAAPHTRDWHRRGGQVARLEAYLEKVPGPRVLVGDLNATPLWPVYRRLTARLDDGARIVAARAGRAPRRTWGPTEGAPRLLRIDHVLVDAVEVHDVRVVSLRGSDHSAVVVDLA
jgi:endonuclease/exonuclease/phosphatase (EEP) superfamily protein YafD